MSSKKYFLVSLIIAAALSAIAPSWAAENKSAALSASNPEGGMAYVIGPQNVVQVKIFGDASTNQIYRVDELGYIRHGLVGPVKIGGMTVAEAEKFMEQSLAGDYIIDPHVTIFILEHSHFSVIGEVKRPGVYEILGQVSVIEAISMAGGFSQVADQRNIKIVRKKAGKQSTISVDSTRITQRGDANADVSIQADDVVSVGKSFF